MTLQISTVKIEPTTYCNIKCEFCSNPSLHGRDTITFTDFEHIWKMVSRFNPRNISFTGLGESLINKDLFKMINHCSNDSNVISLVTNGMLLKKKTEPLIDAKITRLAVSIETLNKDKFEGSRLGANLNRILDGLIHFKTQSEIHNLSVEIGILCVLLPQTSLDDALELATFCKNEGLSRPHFYPSYNHNDIYVKRDCSWEIKQLDDLNQKLNLIFPNSARSFLCREHFLLQRIRDGFDYSQLYCREPNNTLVFRADGTLGLCNESIFFIEPQTSQSWRNKEQDIDELLMSDEFEEIRNSLKRGSPIGECKSCSAFKLISGETND